MDAKEQKDTIKAIKQAWGEYKSYLMEKYPVPTDEGKEWEFACEHHKKIDSLLEMM